MANNVTYKSIFDLSEINTLYGSDKLLIARGNRDYYSTYSSSFDTLSSQIC